MSWLKLDDSVLGAAIGEQLNTSSGRDDSATVAFFAPRADRLCQRDISFHIGRF
ncbi:MAG TPA: hypothetical protein VFO40_07410 [Chthoniobacterales bacterium]|nr:hypothetical protein [Chthoniobacterales bacterium]